MAIMKEYCCAAHGDFDATEPVCPEGCGSGMVERVFRTAPAIQTAGYRAMNATFDSLAAEQGVTNMNNSSGEGLRRADAGAYRRLAHATDVLMSQHTGQDVSGMFADPKSRFATSGVARPVGEAISQTADTRGHNGTIYRGQDGTVRVGADIPLAKPQARSEGSFDGRSLGAAA